MNFGRDVYLNLNGSGYENSHPWSIRNCFTNRVDARANVVVLKEAFPIVQQGGWRRYHKNNCQRKNVHAYMRGIFTPSFEEDIFLTHNIEIGYNPKIANLFYYKESGCPIPNRTVFTSVLMAHGLVYIQR